MKTTFTTIITSLLFFTIGISQKTIIRNTNIVDVEKGRIIPSQHIVIEGATIVSITSKKIKTDDSTIFIDGANKYIIPGMMDTHIHFFQTGGLYTRPDVLDLTKSFSYRNEIQFAKNLVTDSFKRYLKLGITTVMDVGGPFYNFKIRDSIAKENLSPNVYLTGPLFSPYQPQAFSNLSDIPIEKIDTKEEATKLFNKMLPYQPDFIKIWYITSEDEPAENNYELVRHIAKLTHEQKLKLAVHATDLNTAKLAVKAGADILVHSVRDVLVDDEFKKLLQQNNVTYIPTLIVSKNYAKAFLARPDNHPQDLAYGNPRVYGSLTDLKRFASTEVPDRIKRIRKNEKSYMHRYALADSIQLQNLKSLVDYGINVATGSDAGNIGTLHASSYIQEIEAMQKSGISPLDILRASTINAAKGFGVDNKIGSIQAGKIADLVILNQNPLENIKNITTIDAVIKDGQLLDLEKLSIETPEQIVQRQLNAYNARDIDAFMDTFSADVKAYDFPMKLQMNGKEEMRERYEKMFDRYPNLYSELKNRMILGNKVLDREHIRIDDQYIEIIAMYEVTDSKISKVTFIRDAKK